jgi:hypothetical protein
MSRNLIGLGLLTIVVIGSVGTAGDTKKEADAPKLPKLWDKLDLTKEQMDKSFAVLKEYKPKMKAAEQHLAKVRESEHAEMIAVLTDSQKAQLLKILTENPTKKEEYKPADTKKNKNALVLPWSWEPLTLTTDQRDRLKTIRSGYKMKITEAVLRCDDVKVGRGPRWCGY